MPPLITVLAIASVRGRRRTTDSRWYNSADLVGRKCSSDTGVRLRVAVALAFVPAWGCWVLNPYFDAESDSTGSGTDSATGTGGAGTSGAGTGGTGTTGTGTGGAGTGGTGPATSETGDATTSGAGTGGTTTGAMCTPTTPDVIPSDCGTMGVTLTGAFATDVTCRYLASPSSVAPIYGGAVSRPGFPNQILMGGNGETPQGGLWAVELARDADCHVLGYTATAPERLIDAAEVSTGVEYDRDGVLLVARWRPNELGQILPGSTSYDKIIDWEPMGMAPRATGLAFVPPGFSGAGTLKVLSYMGGQWHSVSLTADGGGTFDVSSVVEVMTLAGGPSGIEFMEAGNPEFGVDGVLIAEYEADRVVAYDVDANGDPIPATRRPVIGNLYQVDSFYRDPLSGDLLVASNSSGGVLILQGFSPPP